MEILNIQLNEKRYIVTNKGKIIIVTYNRRYAESLTELLNKYDWPVTYELNVRKKPKVL